MGDVGDVAQLLTQPISGHRQLVLNILQPTSLVRQVGMDRLAGDLLLATPLLPGAIGQ